METIAVVVFFGLFGTVFGIFLPGALLLGKLQASARTRLARKKILSNTSVKAEYSAPDDLTPVEIGFLFDNHFSSNEFFAAILELRDKGFLQTEFKGDKLHYAKLPRERKDLLPYQSLLLKQMDTLPESGLVKPKSVIYLQNTLLSNAVKQDLRAKGYYLKSKFYPERLLKAFFAALALGIFFAVSLAYVLMQPTSETGINYSVNGNTVDSYPLWAAAISGLMFGSFVVVFGFVQWLIVFFLYYRMLGFGPDATDKLKAIWPQILGYKIYLETVEQDNLTYELQTEKSIKNSELAAGLALGIVPCDSLMIQD